MRTLKSFSIGNHVHVMYMCLVQVAAIAGHVSDVMTQTRLRQTNQNGG